MKFIQQNRCPVCRELCGTPRLKLKDFSVFVCSSCGLRYIDPSLDGQSQMEIYQTSETLAKINPALKHYYEYDTLDKTTRTYKDYIQALNRASRLTDGRELLEVGCGTGSFLQAAKTAGWEVCGVDSGKSNIDSLSQKGIEGYCQGFLEWETLQRFDVIVLWDLIEHPQDPSLFVAKCYELLKSGGLLLLATPQDPNLLTVLSDLFYDISFGQCRAPASQLYIMEHTSYFNARTLGRLVAQSGFETVLAWKTETDLARYQFPSLVKACLYVIFFLARLFRLQNRLLLIARKK